ncbi:MAG: hypothetical protein FWE90_08245 [Defluviitaleaceae bacterium]|nr:hypothetical protein [Defluviitaleaceae bacterium]
MTEETKKETKCTGCCNDCEYFLRLDICRPESATSLTATAAEMDWVW